MSFFSGLFLFGFSALERAAIYRSLLLVLLLLVVVVVVLAAAVISAINSIRA